MAATMDAATVDRLHGILRRWLIGASLLELLVGGWLALLPGYWPSVLVLGGIHLVAAICSLASCRWPVSRQTFVTGGASTLATAIVVTMFMTGQLGYWQGNLPLHAMLAVIFIGPSLLPLVLATMGLALLVEIEQERKSSTGGTSA